MKFKKYKVDYDAVAFQIAVCRVLEPYQPYIIIVCLTVEVLAYSYSSKDEALIGYAELSEWYCEKYNLQVESEGPGVQYFLNSQMEYAGVMWVIIGGSSLLPVNLAEA